MNDEAMTKLIEIITAWVGTAEFPPGVAVTPSMTNVVDLERYLEQRRHFRGTMKTSSVEEFIKYLCFNAEVGETKAMCFVDRHSNSATSFFDIGDQENPGHCLHQAKLQLRPTPEYKALLDVAGKSLSQRTLSEFFLDWISYVSLMTDADGVIPVIAGINAIRDVTIEKLNKTRSAQTRLSSITSSIESIEAKSEFSLPATFTYICRPFEGFDEIEFSVDVRVSNAEVGQTKAMCFVDRPSNNVDEESSGNPPRFILRITREDFHLSLMADEFKEIIREGIKKFPIPVFLGTFDA